jgi:Tfp pilus assembly protein PilN
VRPVNLLPEQHRRGPREGAMAGGAYGLIGLLAVLLVMAVAYTLASNQANSRKTEAAEARQEAARLETRAASLGEFGNFAQIKAARAASVKQLAGGRFDWERMLRELAAVLPPGGWLQEVSASVTGEVDGAAGAAAPAAPATPAASQPALSLTGCMTHQSDVAAFMVRLRKLYLVSEVQLEQSAQAQTADDQGDDVSGQATLDNCAQLFKFDLLVTFSSAAPTADEAPQGHESVPARLGGGS